MKFSAEKQDNKIIVKVQLAKNETINKFDYGIISNGTYKSLSKVSQMQFDDERMLVYHVLSDKNLKEWLSEKHTEFEFTSVLSSVAKTFTDVVDGGLLIDNVLCDEEHVFINDKNKTAELLYIPINGYKSETAPYKLISQIIKNVKFQPDEMPAYLSELESAASKGDISFKKFAEKIDESCGKSVREEHVIIFEGGDEEAKKKIKKNREIFLKDIPGGTNAIPLQKKVKVEASPANPRETVAREIDRPSHNFKEVQYPVADKKYEKVDTSKSNDSDEEIYSPGGFEIPSFTGSAPSKKKKNKKADKKNAKSAPIAVENNPFGLFSVPKKGSQPVIDIPGGIADENMLSSEAPETKEKKKGFNLTEMLMDYVKKQKEKKNQPTQAPEKKERKKKKKSESNMFEMEIPTVDSNERDNRPKTEETSSKLEVNRDERRESSLKAEIERSEEVIKAERAKLEEERAKQEAELKRIGEEQRQDAERRKLEMEEEKRKAEELREAEEKKLIAERDKIAKAKEEQQKESLRISEEKKRIEAERAKLEKEREERALAEKKREEEKKIIEAEHLRSKEQKEKEASKDEIDLRDKPAKKGSPEKREEPSLLDILGQRNTEDDDPSGPTVLLENNNYAAYLCPKLLRKRTNETVCISKSAYRIGKEKSNVDYCISNNSAISRLHAIIYCKEGRYYIVDTLSTNHTFVNGKIITSNQNYELLSGDIITLANEDFEFTI